MNTISCRDATLNPGDDEGDCSDTEDAGVSSARDADDVSVQSAENALQDTPSDTDKSAWGNYLWGLAFGESEGPTALESALVVVRVL